MTEDADGRRQRLRRQIAERLTTGVLPRHQGQRVFGGRGEGRPCGCCDEPIAVAEVQYDLDHRDTLQDAAQPVRTIAMHLLCYRLWVEASESSRHA